MSTINFDTLSPIANPNSRVSYDVRYSAKTGKFTASDDAMERLNLQDNGFKAFQDEQGNVVLMIVPNDDADIFGGRGDSAKSSTFSASKLVRYLNVERTTTWNWEQHDYAGNQYLTFSLLSEEEETEDTAEVVEASVEEDEFQIQ